MIRLVYRAVGLIHTRTHSSRTHLFQTTSPRWRPDSCAPQDPWCKKLLGCIEQVLGHSRSNLETATGYCNDGRSWAFEFLDIFGFISVCVWGSFLCVQFWHSCCFTCRIFCCFSLLMGWLWAEYSRHVEEWLWYMIYYEEYPKEQRVCQDLSCAKNIHRLWIFLIASWARPRCIAITVKVLLKKPIFARQNSYIYITHMIHVCIINIDQYLYPKNIPNIYHIHGTFG